MGIDGLLRQLKGVTRERHMEEYRGLSVAVDTYAWLHRVIKSVAVMEVVRGEVTGRFVQEVMRRVERIRALGVRVVMVFDGAPLPGKLEEERAREKSRAASLEKAQEFERLGDSENALKKYSESIDITPDLAYILIR
jgi:exonuclease-1